MCRKISNPLGRLIFVLAITVLGFAHPAFAQDRTSSIEEFIGSTGWPVQVSAANPLPVTSSGGVGGTATQGNAGSAAQAWFVQEVLGGSVISNTNPSPVTIISGSGTQALSYAAPATPVSVTTSSTLILAAGTYTHTLTLCTTSASAGNVWLNLSGAAAVVSTGMFIPATLGCITIAPPTGAIYGISDSGTDTVTIQGS